MLCSWSIVCIWIASILVVRVESISMAEMENDAARRRLFEWGTTFPGLAQTFNVKLDCTYNDKPMCCSLLGKDEKTTSSAEEGPSPQMVPLARGAAGCQIKRQYVPSPYENYNLELAKNLTDVEIDINRKNLFITFCRAEVDASNIWLERVRVHMETEHVPEGNDDDLKYLSRFVVTKTCTGEGQTELSTTWTEWIEPLTIHARHPFALASCRGVYTPAETRRFKFSTELQSTDYVLVQSGTSLHEQTLLRRHNHTRMEAHRNRQPIHRESHLQTHNYFFDAGTSTFESSLRWFLCAYMQRMIAFDQDFGFEYTLLEPTDFWRRVPPKLRSIYHFYNAPVSHRHTDTELSIVDMIMDVATPEDFVAFKLDIDTPEVEIPIALELLRRPEVSRLVDEFFFELHFRCEVLMYCGWGDHMPLEIDGLRMNREGALNYFRQLRELGIRAHIWP